MNSKPKAKKRTKPKAKAKPIYTVLSRIEKPNPQTLRQLFVDFDLTEDDPHAISIPKTAENVEKLWMLGWHG